jgi:thiamine-phosphate pyrophosphorylase
MEKRIDYSLYLVTDRRWLGERTLWEAVEEAIRGGVTLVQLREKEISSREYLELAQKVKAVTDRYGVPLIINDRIDIALAADADGLHVGPEDLPVPIARKLLGEGKIIGASAATLAEARLCRDQGADYLGVGAVFPTATKENVERVSFAELEGIKAGVDIPIVAIGGISEENVASVMKTGVDGVAVVTAIVAQADIRGAARRLSALIREVKR